MTTDPQHSGPAPGAAVRDGDVGTTLVLGGTGKTGRRVAARLAARGAPSRIGTRGADPPFDWDDRTTWPAVVTGVRSVYLAFAPDLAVPGSVEKIASLTLLAADEGVQRLVLLSGRGEPENEQSEQVVQHSKIPWTVLRCSWFAQNFSEGYFLDGLLDGELALPADGVREPFVDAEDIADLAVAALTEDGHAGQLYELTGPDLLTFADAVDEIADATGRRLHFQPVPMSAWTAELARQDVPADVVSLLRYLFTTVLDGRNESLTDGVQRGLGRPPRAFADYVRRTAATGVWDPR